MKEHVMTKTASRPSNAAKAAAKVNAAKAAAKVNAAKAAAKVNAALDAVRAAAIAADAATTNAMTTRKALSDAFISARALGVADDATKSAALLAIVGARLGIDTDAASVVMGKSKPGSTRCGADQIRTDEEHKAYNAAHQTVRRAALDAEPEEKKAERSAKARESAKAKAPAPAALPSAAVLPANKAPDLQAREGERMSRHEHAALAKEAAAGFKATVSRLHNACARYNAPAREAYAALMTALANYAKAYEEIEQGLSDD